MSESVNGGSNNPAQPPKKEMSMEMRLLLAFLLMGAVMFLTPYIFPTPAKPPAKKDAATAVADTSPRPPPGRSQAAAGAVRRQLRTPPPRPPCPPTPLRRRPNRPSSSIPTSIASPSATRARPCAAGSSRSTKATTTSRWNWSTPRSGLDFPFSLYFPGQKPAANVNWAWYKQTGDPDGLGVTYEFSDGHVVGAQGLPLPEEQLPLEGLDRSHARRQARPPPDPVARRLRRSDRDHGRRQPAHPVLRRGAEQARRAEPPRQPPRGPITANGNFRFAGIADTYFAAVFLPEGAASTQQVTFEDTVTTPPTPKRSPSPLSGVAVGDGPSNRFELFVGPKDLDLLARINPKLEQVVDFGWMSDPRQAALPDRQLRQRHRGPQLRLVHRAGHRSSSTSSSSRSS